MPSLTSLQSLFTIPRITLISVLEIIAVARYYYYSALTPAVAPFPALAAGIFVANYTFLFIWEPFIYPFCFHPLRHFPAPKVGNRPQSLDSIYSSANKRNRRSLFPGCTPA